MLSRTAQPIVGTAIRASRMVLRPSLRSFNSSAWSAQAKAATSKGESSKAGASATVLSSCPAGTTLSGLNIYKDRADPVALPDDQYPAWLWNILDEGKKDASGITLISTEGMTKGEARIAEKKNIRMIRAAQRAKERLAARQESQATGQAMRPEGSVSGDLTGGNLQDGGLMDVAHSQEEALASHAAALISDPMATEAEAKKALRKANRARIKARNFIKAQ